MILIDNLAVVIFVAAVSFSVSKQGGAGRVCVAVISL